MRAAQSALLEHIHRVTTEIDANGRLVWDKAGALQFLHKLSSSLPNKYLTARKAMLSDAPHTDSDPHEDSGGRISFLDAENQSVRREKHVTLTMKEVKLKVTKIARTDHNTIS